MQVPEYKYEMRLPKQKCYLFANPMLKTKKKKISITFKMCKKRERQQRPPGGASQRAAKRNRKCRRWQRSLFKNEGKSQLPSRYLHFVDSTSFHRCPLAFISALCMKYSLSFVFPLACSKGEINRDYPQIERSECIKRQGRQKTLKLFLLK